MSAYNARRAPNVSRYLANLNTMPSPPDSANQQQNLALADNSLDFLTNTEFFDFDQFNPAAAAFDSQLPHGELKDGTSSLSRFWPHEQIIVGCFRDRRHVTWMATSG